MAKLVMPSSIEKRDLKAISAIVMNLVVMATTVCFIRFLNVIGLPSNAGYRSYNVDPYDDD